MSGGLVHLARQSQKLIFGHLPTGRGLDSLGMFGLASPLGSREPPCSLPLSNRLVRDAELPSKPLEADDLDRFR